MTLKDTLLPHNASPLERAMEQSTARVGDVPVPLADLWNPWTCPLEFLPWLAWALSTDRWETEWTEEQKRTAVANSIEFQRKKGTPGAVDSVLASFDDLLKMTEWFEMVPPGTPHTFDIELPLISARGDLGGERSSAEFAEAIIRDVMRTKPARSHFRLIQSLGSAVTIDVIGAGRVGGYRRGDYAADVTSAAQDWSGFLLTEDGEPLLDEAGNYLEVDLGLSAFANYAVALSFEHGEYWEGGVRAAALSDLSGYSFTRSGEQGAQKADGSVEWFAADTPAINNLGFHAFPAATNPVLYSRDLTNAAWNKRGTATAVKDGTAGPDGAANAATLLSVSGLGSNDCYQTVGNYHGRSLFIKRVSTAGILTIANPWAGADHWRVDLSLLSDGWEYVTADHPAVIEKTGPTGNGGFHFGSEAAVPLSFYVDLVELVDAEFLQGGPIMRTTNAPVSVGPSKLGVSDAVGADADQLFLVRAKPGGSPTWNARLATWGDGTANNEIDLYINGTGLAVSAGISAAGAAVYAPGSVPFADGDTITAVVRRLEGNWRFGLVIDGVLTWVGADAAGAFPACTTLAPGRYLPSDGQEFGGEIAAIGRITGTFDTDAKVLAAAMEIATASPVAPAVSTIDATNGSPIHLANGVSTLDLAQ